MVRAKIRAGIEVENMLGKNKGRKLTEYVHDYTVYDLETTGVNVNKDRVVEIAAVKVRDGIVVDDFTSLVNPECKIPANAVDISGITDDMVKDAPKISQILPKFLEFIADDVLVGHNIHYFDNKFIYRFSEMISGKVPDNDYVDTLLLARGIFPDMKRHRLIDMIEYYDVQMLEAHRALSDSRMNQQVYECLGKDLNRIGIDESRIKKCPRCGEPMRKRNGKYGMFWGCSGYPDCRYTVDV